MNAPATPRTIDEYLDQVRQALAGADPALIQDALYDAEEHLRSEAAENPGMDEAALIGKIASSYGAPEEVAAIYRDTEVTVSRAMTPPRARPRQSALGKFFGVVADPRTYASLFYMLFSLATGIFYFTWAVTGVSLSAGFAILIIGVPFVILFMGSVRILSLVEGRIVETLLGVRMPRRPLYANRNEPWGARIKELFTDPRSWSTLLYMVAMLPLGILYFTVSITFLAVSLAFIASPFAAIFGDDEGLRMAYDNTHFLWNVPPYIGLPLLFVAGVLLLFATLHLARGVGHVHGQIAKNLLVKSAD